MYWNINPNYTASGPLLLYKHLLKPAQPMYILDQKKGDPRPKLTSGLQLESFSTPLFFLLSSYVSDLKVAISLYTNPLFPCHSGNVTNRATGFKKKEYRVQLRQTGKSSELSYPQLTKSLPEKADIFMKYRNRCTEIKQSSKTNKQKKQYCFGCCFSFTTIQHTDSRNWTTPK